MPACQPPQEALHTDLYSCTLTYAWGQQVRHKRLYVFLGKVQYCSIACCPPAVHSTQLDQS